MKITIIRRQKAEGRRQSRRAGFRYAQKEGGGIPLSTVYCLLSTAFCFLLSAFCFLPTAYCLLPASAQEPPLEEVVEKLQNKYRQTATLSADFHQINFYKALNQKQESDGKVWIKKPGKMRWDYIRPEKNQIMSDGQILWIYTPAEKQVIKSRISQAFTSAPQDFLMGLGDISRRFQVAYGNPRRNPQGLLVLQLTPKEKEPTVSQITVEIAPQDFAVERFSLVDLYGNRTTLVFAHSRFNQDLADSLFQFKVPKGVEVVSPPGGEMK